jgi:hypothetical protein
MLGKCSSREVFLSRIKRGHPTRPLSPRLRRCLNPLMSSGTRCFFSSAQRIQNTDRCARHCPHTKLRPLSLPGPSHTKWDEGWGCRYSCPQLPPFCLRLCSLGRTPLVKLSKSVTGRSPNENGPNPSGPFHQTVATLNLAGGRDIPASRFRQSSWKPAFPAEP